MLNFRAVRYTAIALHCIATLCCSAQKQKLRYDCITVSHEIEFVLIWNAINLMWWLATENNQYIGTVMRLQYGVIRPLILTLIFNFVFYFIKQLNDEKFFYEIEGMNNLKIKTFYGCNFYEIWLWLLILIILKNNAMLCGLETDGHLVVWYSS